MINVYKIISIYHINCTLVINIQIYPYSLFQIVKSPPLFPFIKFSFYNLYVSHEKQEEN